MEITLEKTIADKLDLRRVTNSSKKTLRKFNLRYEIRTIEGEPQRFVIYFKMDVYNTAAFKLNQNKRTSYCISLFEKLCFFHMSELRIGTSNTSYYKFY